MFTMVKKAIQLGSVGSYGAYRYFGDFLYK